MSIEPHTFSTRDDIALEQSFIDLDAIPAGFVVIKVRDKEFLLPRQFAGLIFHHRGGPENFSTAPGTSNQPPVRRSIPVNHGIEMEAYIWEAKILAYTFDLSYKDALRQLYTNELAKITSQAQALAALIQLRQQVERMV